MNSRLLVRARAAAGVVFLFLASAASLAVAALGKDHCSTLILNCNTDPGTLLCADAGGLSTDDKTAIKNSKLKGFDDSDSGIDSNGDGTGFAASAACYALEKKNLPEKTTIAPVDGGAPSDVTIIPLGAKEKVASVPSQCALSPSDEGVLVRALRTRNDVMIVSYGTWDELEPSAAPDSPRIVFPPSADLSPASESEPDHALPAGSITTNTRLWVFVIRPKDFPSQVSIDGAPAQVTAPGIVSSSGLPTGGTGLGDAGATRNAQTPCTVGTLGCCYTDTWSVAPRPAGSYKVTTRLINQAGDPYKPSSHVDEIIVEGLYIGAVRVGVGAIVPFGQNRDVAGTATYSVRTSPSGGNQIYRDSWSIADLELIGGYTAFLGHGRRASQVSKGFGVFGGLGLASVSPSTGNVTALNSGYAGLEWSTSGIQFLGLVGLRRETVLLDAYSVSTHVGSGATITTTAYRPALGLMVGFTSDVLKIQAGSVSK